MSNREIKGSVSPFRDKFRAFIGRRYLGLFADEQEAWRKVNAALELTGKRGKVPDTLRVVGDRWFHEREQDGVVRGLGRERSVWRSHIETSKFIDYPVKAIRPKMIKDWLRKLQKTEARHAIVTAKGVEHSGLGRPISQQTIRHARRILIGCLNWARDEGKLSTNPAAEIRVPKRAETLERERIVYLTAEEIDRLFALPLGEMKRAVFAVAVYCGLRAGEIWGLRWQDIDLDGFRPCIRVRRSYNGPTKTPAAVRDVPLLRVPREALRAWKVSGGTVRGIGLVFPSRHGGCYKDGHTAGWTDKPYRVNGQLKTGLGIRTKAGIRDHVHFHDLRHTCASHLIMGTWGRVWSLPEVKAILGHTSITVTERYAHLSPDSIHAAMREMEKNG